jgi:hypothetical protein
LLTFVNYYLDNAKNREIFPTSMINISSLLK